VAPQPARQPVAAPQRPGPVQPAAQQRGAVQPANGAFAPSGTEPAPNWGDLAPSGANAALRRPAPPGKSSARVPAVAASKLARTFWWVVGSMKKRPKVWLIGGGVFLFALVIYIAIASFSKGGSGKTPSTAPASRKVSVSTVPDKGDFRSIKDALVKAQPGDRIVVLDEVLEEPLNLQALTGKLARDLTIEADSALGKRVIWRPPPAREGQSPQSTQLLSLVNCEGLTLKGFQIQGQNGTHQTLDLVVVFGRCPGLRLEDLQFQGFKRSAVKLINCTGESSRPITLKNLHTAQAAAPEASAIVFEIGSTTLTSMQHVRVEDCLFEGPYRSSLLVALAGGTELGNVVFARNRFYKATDGLWYKRPPNKPYAPMTVTFESNTLFGMERGFLFETMPLDERSQVIFKNNLFVQTKVLVQVGDLTPPAADRVFPPQTSNVRDPASKEGNLNIRATQVDCATVIVDAAADKNQLLRYPKNSPLATAGHDKGPVGVPPLE
jgi:hypothetical protein